jgi:hypothetical protein
MTDDYRMHRWTIAAAEPDYRYTAPVAITVNDRAATRQAIIDRLRRLALNFVERSGWKAHATKPVGVLNDWDYTKVAIHHAGRSYACGLGAQQMKDIQEVHQRRPDWPDIGYHYSVACTGEIYEGMDIRFKGSHLYQYNTGVIGIVLLENLADPEEKNDAVGMVTRAGELFGRPRVQDAPEAQRMALVHLVSVLAEYFRIAQLGGHREYPFQLLNAGVDAKICPGNHGMKLVDTLRGQFGFSKPG